MIKKICISHVYDIYYIRGASTHYAKQQLYGQLPPISQSVKVIRTRHGCYCWLSKDEHESDVFQWTSTYEHIGVDQPVKRYLGHSISFQTFLVHAFKIVVDSWKFTMLLLYFLWDDRPILWFKSTATAAIWIHLSKAWFSQLVNFKNAIWTWGHFRRTICNKILFKLGKNATEITYGMLQTAFRPYCMNQASVFEWHKRFKEGCEGWWEVWEE